jgi:hypothetical protein
MGLLRTFHGAHHSLVSEITFCSSLLVFFWFSFGCLFWASHEPIDSSGAFNIHHTGIKEWSKNSN